MESNSHPSCAPPVLAVDIGGTKILTALVSTNGDIIARDYASTPSQKSAEAVVQQVAEAAERVMGKTRGRVGQPSAVAAAVAGLIEIRNGVVTTSPNLPMFHDTPARSMLEERLGLKAFLLNDATAATWGEYRLGAGRGTKDLIFITVSTGIGGGIVMDGRLCQGTCGAAGEVGHMIVCDGGPECSCGNRGCLEALASGTAIAREAQEHVARGAETSISRLAGRRPITAEVVATAAKAGDAIAQQVISRAAYYLGIGLMNLVHIFNPDMIVIGGGVSQMGEMLLEPARSVVQDKAFRLPSGSVRIVPAKMGINAGIVGAALYAFESATNGMAQ
ncbi:MAG: ROK family protein [Chloroflexi bacterium]|nr:ROK family protein [Chloroflexota bacterium]